MMVWVYTVYLSVRKLGILMVNIVTHIVIKDVLFRSVFLHTRRCPVVFLSFLHCSFDRILKKKMLFWFMAATMTEFSEEKNVILIYGSHHDGVVEGCVQRNRWGGYLICVVSWQKHQNGQMPRLIWVFTGHTFILLVLSWGGSFIIF